MQKSMHKMKSRRQFIQNKLAELENELKQTNSKGKKKQLKKHIREGHQKLKEVEEKIEKK